FAATTKCPRLWESAPRARSPALHLMWRWRQHGWRKYLVGPATRTIWRGPWMMPPSGASTTRQAFDGLPRTSARILAPLSIHTQPDAPSPMTSQRVAMLLALLLAPFAAAAQPIPSPPLVDVQIDLASLHRYADESDNYHLTWSADDDLYGAYGDGWGFVRT